MHTSRGFRTARSRLATAIVVAWGIGVGTLLARLGAECAVSGSALRPGEAQGWTLRYELSPQDRVGESLIRRLIARHARSDFGTEIVLHGDAGWANRLADAGWKTVAAGAEPVVPHLDILNARRAVIWTGLVPGDDLLLPGAALLDRELLARVVRGQSTPHVVPVGCAPPSL